MRRLSLLLAIVVTALVAITGVAFADTIDCIANRICVGTDGPDTLDCTSRSDYIEALQGNDQLFGHESYDVLMAMTSRHKNTSTDGNDRLGGGQNFDELYGYGGNDKLLGRSSGDFIFAEESSENEGEDIVQGNEGNDYILARDGVADTIRLRHGKARHCVLSMQAASTRSVTAANARGVESTAWRRPPVPPARPRK